MPAGAEPARLACTTGIWAARGQGRSMWRNPSSSKVEGVERTRAARPSSCLTARPKLALIAGRSAPAAGRYVAGDGRGVHEQPLRPRSGAVPRANGTELGDEEIDAVGGVSRAYPVVAAERGQSVQRGSQHGESVDVPLAGRAHRHPRRLGRSTRNGPLGTESDVCMVQFKSSQRARIRFRAVADSLRPASNACCAFE